MSSNICGNCDKFKPKQGERFFNCTYARHAGVSYGMQVRADTRSCDAFIPFKTSPPHPAPSTSTIRKTITPKIERPRPTGLCPWGRAVLIIGLIIAILVIAGLAYMCGSNLLSSPAATPTPTPTSVPTPGYTIPPKPTPTPVAYDIRYYEIGGSDWAMGSTTWVLISSAWKGEWYKLGMGTESAPPGMTFIMLHVTVFNRSQTSYSPVTPKSFYLTDISGYEYLSQLSRQPYYIGNPLFGNPPPGATYTGEILYVVPQPAWGLEVSILLDSTAVPPIIAKWKLPW